MAREGDTGVSDRLQRRREVMARVALRRDDLALAWSGMATSVEDAEIRVRRGIRIARAVGGALALAGLARAAFEALRGRTRLAPSRASAVGRWSRIATVAARAIRYVK